MARSGLSFLGGLDGLGQALGYESVQLGRGNTHAALSDPNGLDVAGGDQLVQVRPADAQLGCSLRDLQ